jgi:malate synthase
MEDAATAEISRSQVWQWVRHGRVSREQVERALEDVVAELPDDPVIGQARALFEHVALGERFEEFLTLPAYEQLLEREHAR